MSSLPIDLIHEILSRLPAKSIKRFRCVSKLWCSMLCSTYFTELFKTRSSARPRLLFAVEKEFQWHFFSSAQYQNPYEKSSLVVDSDFHMKFSKDRHKVSPGNCSYVSGLIYFANMRNLRNCYENAVICNPSTGQHAVLPELRPKFNSRLIPYLGFDPIDKQFKVLVMSTVRYVASNEIVHLISTLGTGETIRWRNIQCPFNHEPFSEGICINGVLYYRADKPNSPHNVMIVCFDVRSEQFKFLDAKFCGRFSGTINYKGKLGVIDLKYDGGNDGGFPLTLRIWVLEDLEKQEWSKHSYTLGDENESVKVKANLSVASGITAAGEIVLYMDSYTYKEPFYVFYFNPERNTLRSVEIQGFEEELFNDHHIRVHAFVDHVEDLHFNIMKTTATSITISPPEKKPKPTITSATSISPREEKLKPTIPSASSRQDHQVRTVAHMQQDHQSRTVAHMQQDHQPRTVAHMQQDHNRGRSLTCKTIFNRRRLLTGNKIGLRMRALTNLMLCVF